MVILSKHREPKVAILSDIAAYFLGHVSFSRQANAVPMSERCRFQGSGYSLAVFGGRNEVVKFHCRRLSWQEMARAVAIAKDS